MLDRKQETKAVKAALVKAGIPVISVKHGHGTAWGWLTVKLAAGQQQQPALGIVQQVTGRHASDQYDGRIAITFDWN